MVERCKEHDSVMYKDVLVIFTYENKDFRVVDIFCDDCKLSGVQVEVYDADEDNWLFVEEKWNVKN